MADFAKYYPTLVANEGYYANDPQDAGGETYMGVARTYWPQWQGWAIIDAYKAQKGWPRDTSRNPGKAQASLILRNNRQLPALVYEFYKARYWDKQHLSELQNQSIAEALADYGVNAGTGRITIALQYALSVTLGLPVKQDGVLGPKTLAAANAAPQRALYDALIAQRKGHHYYRATGSVWYGKPVGAQAIAQHAALTKYVTEQLRVSYNPTQKKYLNSWLSRCRKPFAPTVAGQ